ncbi:UbiA-domain-containing protein [Ophiobolus disseminans]|uniref:UbiA-domain-containing protein n=1 Tax=Ophiobolus disseminans TaxID=1469910 RepID=A0A6A7ANB5_9PLEO|nr:UbiA-domain-containing protein [Ophiobolus disseminans]
MTFSVSSTWNRLPVKMSHNKDVRSPILTKNEPTFPSYRPPTTGFVSYLPSSWVPYAQLMRLDRPAGFYAFYFPYLVGLAFAAANAPIRHAPEELMRYAGLFFVWCIVLRGASCTWNDNLDQEYDRAVARCRNRPIARGAVLTAQAHVFTALQLLTMALFLAVTPFPATTHPDAAFIVVLFFIYPFGKRFTNYPQFILGFPFAAATFMACHTLSIDPMSRKMLLPTSLFCLSNVCWTMIYDTIYAHQDLQDDLKAGVMSMAVRFKDNTKQMCSVLAVTQIGLLSAVGALLNLGLPYYIVTVAGTASCIAAMIHLVDLKVPKSCAWWFKADFWFVGSTMFFGLLGQYGMRYL